MRQDIDDFGSGANDRFAPLRQRMVSEQILRRGIDDEAVIEVMSKLPRHLFVPEEMQRYAYDDTPLPIGFGQTISQPYIVALMTSRLKLSGTERVLEIGTGSGYQTAILAHLSKEVYSIEIIPQLHARAKELLLKLGLNNVHLRSGNGYSGWPEHAPFDRILLTAAPPYMPESLIKQLAPTGIMIAPIGSGIQKLVLIRKDEEGNVYESTIEYVRFVPMVFEKENE